MTAAAAGAEMRVAVRDMKDTALAGHAGALKDAVLIAGPTASGKSAQAMRLAERLNGVVINADSMQVYRQLRVLTARPEADDERRVPHLLYDHVEAWQSYSTAAWLDDVASLVTSGALAGRRPILVGGTGLYFTALTEGLSEMPPVPASIRAAWRGRLAGEGAAALHRVLEHRDPQAAEAIRSGDGQRIVRALEVLEASGRSIRDWQGARRAPPIDSATALKFVIEADRELLAQRISRRFDAMLDSGAVEEVQSLVALDLPAEMPIMKAIGVREVLDFCEGRVPSHIAVDRAKAATRQYAKRQQTWFRNQMGPDWQRVTMGAAIEVGPIA